MKVRRFLMVLLAWVGLALGTMAQNVPAKSFPNVKVVKVMSDKVNIRKQPNVQSPKVSIANRNEELCVIGERGDWYKVVWDGEEEDSRAGVTEVVEGYLMKKFCEEKELEKPILKVLNSEDGYWFSFRERGKHKGLVIEQDNTGFMPTIYLGQIVDNILFFNKFTMQTELFDHFKYNSEKEFFDFDNITDAQVDLLLKVAIATDLPHLIYKTMGDNSWTEHYYNVNQ